jgi:O-antigen/teichoic acid export membrane protein
MPKLRKSETTRAAELGIAALVGNVVALVFTVVFTRVLGQDHYGSLAALLSTFLILTVPGYALQTTVAREVSAAVAAGDPTAGAAVGRWLRRLLMLAVALAALGAIARHPLAALIGVDDFPWGAAGALVAGALWLLLSVERGALVGFRRYRLVGASIVVEQLARLLCGLALVGANLSVTGAFLGTPLALAIVALALWRPLSHSVGHAVQGDDQRLRDLIVRAWAPIGALGLIAWLQDGHIIIVKHLASGHDAGAWAAVSVAAKAIMFVAIGLSGYLVPEVAGHAERGEDPRTPLLRTMGLVGALAVPMVLVYLVAAKPVLHIAFHVKGGAGALPLVGLAMAMLAFTYLTTQYQLALHRKRFIVALAAAAIAQPLILLAIGSNLTPLALGLALLNTALAAVMVTLAGLRRGRLGAPLAGGDALAGAAPLAPDEDRLVAERER